MSLYVSTPFEAPMLNHPVGVAIWLDESSKPPLTSRLAAFAGIQAAATHPATSTAFTTFDM